MAITFDTSAIGTRLATDGGTSITLAFTGATGATLLVGVLNSGTTNSTAFQYNGVDLTAVGVANNNNGLIHERLWTTTSIGTCDGNSHDIVFDFASALDVIVIGASFLGVGAIANPSQDSRATGTSTTPSTTETSASGELVVDCVGTIVGVSLTKDASQTLIRQGTAGSIAGGMSYEAGAASVVMSWTLSPSLGWAISALALQPTAAATAAVKMNSYRQRRI